MEFPINEFQRAETPFYYYDLGLLRRTLAEVKRTAGDVYVSYAVKANNDARILKLIAEAGLGADCVSGGEIEASLAAGFPAGKITFAGVGKTDREITIGLTAGIGCFNIESLPELEVINELAGKLGKVAPVAIRVNPNIDAHTHSYITTGLAENKFGINLEQLADAVAAVRSLPNVSLRGLHFHVGSQVLSMEPYAHLCRRVAEIEASFPDVEFKVINVGGGLGIDYENPDANPIPDFGAYFSTLHNNLQLRPGQEVHCELGRSIVGQCGSLISRVVYVKHGTKKDFVIVDGGMSELIRPALYDAHHPIQNLSASTGGELMKYDVVGPVCESSDVFATDELLPETRRGDLIAFRCAGAYGETMASNYNLRQLNPSIYYED